MNTYKLRVELGYDETSTCSPPRQRTEEASRDRTSQRPLLFVNAANNYNSIQTMKTDVCFIILSIEPFLCW